jgi:TRAP-type C4-dicarboxylate transport system substrate-binding protein
MGLAGFLAVVLTLGIVVLPAFSAQETLKWRLQTSDPAAGVPSSYLQEDFIDKVKKMSNGRLDITLYSAGQLVPSLEVANALKSGMVDISYIAGAYFTGAIPEAGLEYNALPPALLQDQDDLMEVYWNRGLDNVIREGYAKKGIYYLGTFMQGDANTHWSRNPIRSAADLKGYKIRAYGYANKVFQKLGATPVFIPLEEAYSALSQGVIDGYYTGGKHYLTSKMYEVAPYYHLPGWNPVVSMCILISMNSWNKLPADLKAILQETLMSFSVNHFHKRYEIHRQMVQDFPKMGVKLVSWPKEEMEKLREAAITFLPEIAAKSPLNAKGVKIMTDYMKELKYMK